MNGWKVARRSLLPALAAYLLCFGSAEAKKPDNSGGGDGGGGSQIEYTILDLPAPDYELNGGDSIALTRSISDISVDGTVHVVGSYESQDGTRKCCWAIGATGEVVPEDLSSWFGAVFDLDVNSAGIIAGSTQAGGGAGGSPALLSPNRQLVILPGASSAAAPRLNNPDDLGVFQAVANEVLWDIVVADDGMVTVLGTTSLIDPDGLQLFARDINDFGEIGGYISVNNEMVPAIGEFNSAGQLQISLLDNPNPEVITGFRDFEIDNGGNLLGYGVEPAPTIGVYPRAVIWPASGGAIDLVAEESLSTAEGNGIAWVDGVMQVVGRASDRSGGFSYRYTISELGDLEMMSEGDQPWDFSHAEGINNSGMICARGKVGRRRDYQIHGCILMPNP